MQLREADRKKSQDEQAARVRLGNDFSIGVQEQIVATRANKGVTNFANVNSGCGSM